MEGKTDERKRTKKVCAVAVCPSPKDRDIIYHVFPKDKSLEKEWIVKSKRNDSFSPRFASICSNHFLPSDYERDLKSELMGLPTKKKLKTDAIPSLNLLPIAKPSQVKQDFDIEVCRFLKLN
jgi:hypothetical protein